MHMHATLWWPLASRGLEKEKKERKLKAVPLFLHFVFHRVAILLAHQFTIKDYIIGTY